MTSSRALDAGRRDVWIPHGLWIESSGRICPPSPRDAKTLRVVWALRHREHNRAKQPGSDAVDPERGEPVGLEEAQQELDREVCGDRRARGAHEGGPAHAPAVGAE